MLAMPRRLSHLDNKACSYSGIKVSRHAGQAFSSISDQRRTGKSEYFTSVMLRLSDGGFGRLP